MIRPILLISALIFTVPTAAAASGCSSFLGMDLCHKSSPTDIGKSELARTDSKSDKVEESKPVKETESSLVLSTGSEKSDDPRDAKKAAKKAKKAEKAAMKAKKAEERAAKKAKKEAKKKEREAKKAAREAKKAERAAKKAEREAKKAKRAAKKAEREAAKAEEPAFED